MLSSTGRVPGHLEWPAEGDEALLREGLGQDAQRGAVSGPLCGAKDGTGRDGQDKATALIGPQSATVKQMECDTDTIFKVTIPKAEEGDNTKASVRIMSRSQDKSSIEKARKKIESFAGQGRLE